MLISRGCRTRTRVSRFRLNRLDNFLAEFTFVCCPRDLICNYGSSVSRNFENCEEMDNIALPSRVINCNRPGDMIKRILSLQCEYNA
jgi:hypothetical protein